MYKKITVLFPVRVSILFVVSFCFSFSSLAGPYLDSTHGDTTNGVNRSSMTGYATGNCGHCHEQHATDLAGGPYNYSLFYDNYVSITPAPPDGLCFKCHDGTANEQSGIFSNYSYSYRAGNWTAGNSPSNIADFFNLTHPQIASYHHLDDIVTFLDTNPGAVGWGYTSDSNPCAACHNPHAAQGDPEGNLAAPKSNATRGWLLSRPSEHTNTPWGLWGDDAGEKMSDKTAQYQAPYRFGSTTAYEPDGTATTDGSNLTDFVTFCTDCHNDSNVIYSTNLGRDLRTINWAAEKHGSPLDTNDSLCGDNPYPSGTSGLGNGLSCLDCHESHGSPNAFLIRAEVNGGVLGGTIGSFDSANWHYLCDRCHQDDKEINDSCQEDHYYIIHHSNEGCNTDRPYKPSSCGSCHSSGGGGSGCTSARNKQICTNCHFHGSTANGQTTF